MSLKSFHIVTYGCQMNRYDSNVIAEKPRKLGLVEMENPQDAEFVMINTCSVREHAENRAIGRIKTISAKNGATKKVAVIGCMAQRIGKELLEEIEGLDYAIGPDHIEMIFDIATKGSENIAFIGPTDYTGHGNYTGARGRISAFVGISRGCDNFCKYCIVPYVRGRFRSRELEDILHEIEELTQNGVREITLLGQNVNAYKYKNYGFSDLLYHIAEINDLKRIRFTTNHPKDLSVDIIDAMSKITKVAPAIHLPVQSGSNKVLEAMGRGYTREKYLELVSMLREKIDNIAIASDILVGYSGESHEDFMQTVDLIEKVGFAGLFCFKYSVRPGTAAAKLKDDVPEKVKLERIEKVIDLGQKMAHEYSQKQISRILDVMIDGKSQKFDGNLRGIAGNSRVVEIETEMDIPTGEIVPVKIHDAITWTLFGKIANGEINETQKK